MTINPKPSTVSVQPVQAETLGRFDNTSPAKGICTILNKRKSSYDASDNSKWPHRGFL